jgi:hypothetical protein
LLGHVAGRHGLARGADACGGGDLDTGR